MSQVTMQIYDSLHFPALVGIKRERRAICEDQHDMTQGQLKIACEAKNYHLTINIVFF